MLLSDCTFSKSRSFCRRWGEDLLSDACRILKEEVDVSPSIHGGKAEYRKTLCISFFFKFYLQVLQEIKGRVSKPWIMSTHWRFQGVECLQWLLRRLLGRFRRGFSSGVSQRSQAFQERSATGSTVLPGRQRRAERMFVFYIYRNIWALKEKKWLNLIHLLQQQKQTLNLWCFL